MLSMQHFAETCFTRERVHLQERPLAQDLNSAIMGIVNANQTSNNLHMLRADGYHKHRLA